MTDYCCPCMHACMRARMNVCVFFMLLSSIAHKTNGGQAAKRKMTAINFHINKIDLMRKSS